jgi:hypothetical protein
MKPGWGAVALAVALVAGCRGTPPATPGGDMGAGSSEELASALNVTVAGADVRFELHVTNATGGPLELEFASAQRYDFSVRDGTGEVVWRWSDEMAFAQVLGTESLAPGETRRYGANWEASGREGEFTATGRLTSTNYPVELRTAFRLPVD